MVNGVAIQEDDFLEWFRTFPGADLFRPNMRDARPSSMRRCIAIRRSQRVNQHAPTEIKRQCAQQYDLLSDQVMTFLVHSTWLRSKAAELALSPSTAEVRATFASLEEDPPGGGAFQAFLARRRMTKTQLRTRIRLDSLGHRLMKRIISPDLTVSREEITEYYQRHRFEFDLPPTTGIRVVVTRTRNRALMAKRALVRGDGWDRVVQTYSQDLSRRSGGRVEVGADNAIPKLRRAVFSAAIGKLAGPLQIAPVWWVFEAKARRGSRELPLRRVEKRIRRIIRSNREAKGLKQLTAYLRSAYRAKTACVSRFAAYDCPVAQPIR
jgi:foldase protein PrsA